ncbi:MAG: putative DNA-binding mobile mystery protein A [Gammaproteobacteria bacterium]|jgi:predicted DNA-binding mobile mystery protein A
MTTSQFAKRNGVSQSRAVEIEKSEVSGSLTIDSLERGALALNCRLVYALVPENSLDKMVEERATKLALSRIQSINHTMALEDQQIDAEAQHEQVLALARKLAEKSGSELWESN